MRKNSFKFLATAASALLVMSAGAMALTEAPQATFKADEALSRSSESVYVADSNRQWRSPSLRPSTSAAELVPMATGDEQPRAFMGFYGGDYNYMMGLAKVNTSNYTYTYLKSYDASSFIANMPMASYAGDDIFYVFCATSGSGATATVSTYNASTGASINLQVGVDWTVIPSGGINWDFDTERIYGSFRTSKDSNSPLFGYVEPRGDVSTLKFTKICELEGGTKTWLAAAPAPDGFIYVIESSGMLARYNKKTGARAEVGNTSAGISSSTFISTACVDWNNGTMWFIRNESDYSYLYKIDISSGSTTKYGSGQAYNLAGGIYVPYEKQQETGNAYPPATPTNLKAQFDGSSLSGTVSFICPDSNLDGSFGEGKLTYSVKVNDEEVATGEADYGQSVSTSVSLAAAGQKEFSVTVANEKGSSGAVTLSKWIGPDVPSAPENVVLHYVNGNYTLSWNAVTTGVHGGSFDASAVTYDVVLQPLNSKIHSAVSATSVSGSIEQPATPSKYYMTVTAKVGDLTSATVESNRVTVGSFSVPYMPSFANEADAALFTIVDGNEDGNIWHVNEGNMVFRSDNGESDKLPNDDWLITPMIHLIAGETYVFFFDAAPYGVNPETFSAWMGNEQSVSAMTTEMVAEHTTSGYERKTWAKEFTVETTGDYCFGVHNTTKNRSGEMTIYSLGVKLRTDYAAPKAVTNLTAKSDPLGALKATISFTAPTETVENLTLPSVEQILIYRDDVLVETMTNVAAGSEITTVDNSIEEQGYYIYKVTTKNAAGQSTAQISSIFVGMNKPGRTDKVDIKETENLGEVTLTWNPVTVDVEGNALAAEAVTYNIVKPSASSVTQYVVEGLTETTYTFQALPEGSPQDFVQYAIEAKTSAGVGTMSVSAPIPVGQPYSMPYIESFPQRQMQYNYAVAYPSGTSNTLGVVDDNFIDGVLSQDDDEGCLAFAGITFSDIAELYFGKIAIEGESPALTFWVYNQGPTDTNLITIAGNSEDGYRSLAQFTPSNPTGWYKYVIPLKEYIGKYVRFTLTCQAASAQVVLFDNFRVESVVADNMTVSYFDAPTKVYANEENPFSVMVLNSGVNNADGWRVKLYRNGELASTRTGWELSPGESAAFEMSAVVPSNLVGDVEFHAEVEYAADGDIADNVSESATSEIIYPLWPTATLAGSKDESKVTLSWAAPEEKEEVAVTETFESYDYGQYKYVGDWRMIDVDGIANFTMNISNTAIDIPGVSGKASPFFIYDQTKAPTNSVLAACPSGDKCLMSQGSLRGDTEDWVITPLLNGKVQTITLQIAASSIRTYNMKIMASKTDRRRESFEHIYYMEASADWKTIRFDVEEGVKYLAFVSIIEGPYGFVNRIDDVTYIPGYGKVDDLIGYSVYRDGECLTPGGPITSLSFVDDNADMTTEHVYYVTTHYAHGISGPSNYYVYDPLAGIEGVGADSPISISGQKGYISIVGAQGSAARVYSIDGKMIANTVCSEAMQIPVQPGFYVVNVGSKTVKVVVR